MNISIDESEVGEYFWRDGNDFDVPDETIWKWDKARQSWEETQEAMGRLIQTREKEANIRAAEAMRIQIEIDRVEVERLRSLACSKH